MNIAEGVAEVGPDRCASNGRTDLLALLGRRWTLQILLGLVHRPLRFAEVKRSVPGLSSNLLAKRLRELEEARMVRRVELPPPVSAVVYDVAERGMTLAPVLLGLEAWAEREG